MFILIPSVLIYSYRRAQNKIAGLFIIIGSLTGILVSGATAMFTYAHRVLDLSFFSNFIYYFLRQYSLPLILLYAIFFLFTHDTVEVRIKAFFYVIASFYAFYMPYSIISSGTFKYSFFSLFMKPALVLSTVFILSRLLFNIYTGASEHVTKKIAANSIIAFFILCVPPALESLYLMHEMLIFVYVVTVLISIYALVLFFLESRQEYKYFF